MSGTSVVTSKITSVYNDFLNNYRNPVYLRKRAILGATNACVKQFNDDKLQQIPGPMQCSYSIDTVEDDEHSTQYPAEFLNNIEISGLPPHQLKLKQYAEVILFRNMNVSYGHCNGSLYMLTYVSNHLLRAVTLHAGETLLLPRIPLRSKDNDFPFIMQRLQFPVQLAYALTYNRAQGQSLKRCGLLLNRSLFNHGQIYVGFSRVGDPKDFFVYANQTEFESYDGIFNDLHVYTRNMVYNEILLTKLKKMIVKTGSCKTRRTKIWERSYHQNTGGLAARKRR
jgi:ATP-dependent DNA helicase PIF1